METFKLKRTERSFTIGYLTQSLGSVKLRKNKDSITIVSGPDTLTLRYDQLIGIEDETFANVDLAESYLETQLFKIGGGVGEGGTTDASELTSGILPTARIGDDSIVEAKLHPDVKTKLNGAIIRESNQVIFTNPGGYIIGNAAPRTGNITFDFTGAKLGSVTKMRHQSGTIPTFPEEAQILSGQPSISVVNHIYFVLTDATIGSEKVEVTIVNSEQSSEKVISELDALSFLGSKQVGMTVGMTSLNVVDNITLSNRLNLHAVYVPKASLINSVSVLVDGVLPAYTATGENRVGIYDISNGTSYELVASSANNGNVWKVDFQELEIPLSAPVLLQAGVYYVALLYSRSAQTTPILLAGRNFSGPYSYREWAIRDTNRFLSAYVAGTTLPSTIANAAVTKEPDMFPLIALNEV